MLSMLTLMPAWFTVWVTRTASAISVPATNRPETRRPIDDRSAKLRRERFSERRTKNVLSMQVPARCGKIRKRNARYVNEDHRSLYHNQRLVGRPPERRNASIRVNN